MKLLLKEGVKLNGLDFSMIRALWVVMAVAQNLGHASVTITSGLDGQHMKGSLHPKGKALDFRLKHLKVADRVKFVEAVREDLSGKDYDVLHESPSKANEHLHVEYDPD